MPSYSEKRYWDRVYEKKANEKYDWYCEYPQFRQFLKHIPKSARILIVGCGNSALPQDLWQDGYHKLTCIDYSKVIIDKMRQKYRALFPSVLFLVQDVTAMTSFSSGKFDVILDKGTLDAIVCGFER